MGLFDGLATGVLQGVGSIFNLGQQQNTLQAQEQMQQNQQQFQTQMSDTAITRQVADMKNAGINPIMSAATGGGASTPTGSMTQLQAPQIQMPDLMGYGISMKQLDQADQKISIDKANSAAGIAKALSDTQINKMDLMLKKQGMLGSALGTDNVTKFQNVIQQLKKSVLSPDSPSNPTSQKQQYSPNFGPGQSYSPSIPTVNIP